MAASDIALEKGLPSNIDAEKFVLGAILLDDSNFVQVAGLLEVEDFSLEKHRRIFLRMRDLAERGERIDRVTVANELMKQNQLESVDGLSYLVSLDDGLPQIFALDSYVKIVKDKSTLRRIVFASQKLIDRCIIGQEEPEEILAGAEETILKLGESRARDTLVNTEQILANFEGGINVFLDPSKRIKGISTGFTKFDEMTAGMHEGELIILAARPSMGKTALALNIAHHVATNMHDPKTVAVFSLEMSADSLLTRMICASSLIDQQKFRAGYLNQDERRKLQMELGRLVQAPLWIDDTSGTNLMDVHAKLRRLKGRAGTRTGDHRLPPVDEFPRPDGEPQPGSQRDLPRPEADGEGNESAVPGALAVEPRARDSSGRSPPAAERPSRIGSIEQDADLVMFIYREEVYNREREDLRGQAKLIIAKQRNGPIGDVNLVFVHHATKFANPIDDMHAGDE